MKLKAIKIKGTTIQLKDISLEAIEKCFNYNRIKSFDRHVKTKTVDIDVVTIYGVCFRFNKGKLFEFILEETIEDSAENIIFIDNEGNEISALNLYNLINMCWVDNDLEMESPYDNIICEPSKIRLGLFIRLRLKEE